MTTVFPPVEYLAVGHVTHDRQPDGTYTLGGTATYATLAAAACGRRVGLVTSFGPDFDLTPFVRAGVAVAHQPAAATTVFENRYQDTRRSQRIHAVAEPLLLETVPEAWRSAPLIHIGPVLDECAADLVATLAGRGFLGLTPQGWLRRVTFQGRVQRAVWASAAEVLPLASAVVLSIEDVGGDWALVRQWAALTPLLVVTQAQAGGVLYVAGKPHPYPAVPAVEVDPTGAGDIFAATFFITLTAGVNPLLAVERAAYFAARAVTQPGLEGIAALQAITS